ncbi:hypothetical protein D3C87_2082140 [compost metagenome]
MGPKNPLAVASWQAKPSICPSLTATQQVMGRLVSATAASAVQPAEKCSEIQSSTTCRSGGMARRTVMPAAATFASASNCGRS